MARTFRRNGAPHLRARALLDHVWVEGFLYAPVPIDAVSPEGRRILARLRSDGGTRRGPPPRFRRPFHRQLRTHNEAQIRRVLSDPGYDPVFETRHLGSARQDWY